MINTTLSIRYWIVTVKCCVLIMGNAVSITQVHTLYHWMAKGNTSWQPSALHICQRCCRKCQLHQCINMKLWDDVFFYSHPRTMLFAFHPCHWPTYLFLYRCSCSIGNGLQMMDEIFDWICIMNLFVQGWICIINLLDVSIAEGKVTHINQNAHQHMLHFLWSENMK